MRQHLRCSRSAALVALSLIAALAHAQAWPELKAPPNARIEAIGDSMVLNGREVRLSRFVVRASDEDVLAFYREQFGARQVVENRIQNDRVIATRRGEHFLTVRLHSPTPGVLEGTAMTTRLSVKPMTSAVVVDTRQLLPTDTKVVSTLQSDDAGKRSLMVVGVNQIGLRANRDHLVQALQGRGFTLEREDSPPAGPARAAITLHLSSPSEEASVTISDAGQQRSILINRVKGGL